MKCPHCSKEIEDAKTIGPMEGFVLPNLLPPSVVIGGILVWLVPLDIRHGYSIEWDMLIVLGLMVLYTVYLVAYLKGKVKGRFVWMKKREE